MLYYFAMKKYIIILVFLLFILTLHAQSAAIQSAMKNFDFETALRLMAKEKQTPELAFQKAKCYKNLGKYNASIVLLEELVKQDGTGLAEVNELADCYQLVGNYKKAKFFYSMALQTAPDSRFAQLNSLSILYKLKEWNQTIKLAHSVLQKDSLSTLYPVLGDCFFQLSKLDSATYYYQKALANTPDDYNTLAKLAKLYIQSEKYHELLRSTNQYLLSDSTNQVINQYNGIGHCMNHDYNKAIYRLNKNLQQGDSSYTTNYYLGACYFATKDYITAYERLDAAYRKDSSNTNLFLYFGKAAILSGHQQKGIDVLNKGLSQIIPKDTVLFNFYYNISVGYNRLFYNCLDEIKYLKLCWKVNPDYKLSLYTIASIYDERLKKYEEALEYYRLFLTTRTKPVKVPDGSAPTISYYTVAENRIADIRTEMEAKKKSK